MKRWALNRRPPPIVRGLLLRAALFIAAFALCELAGLRDCTGFLSGTHPGPWGRRPTALLGSFYLVMYLGATVLAPILLLAAAFLGLGPVARSQFRKRKRA